MSRSPIVARRRLGTALKGLRVEAKLKIEDAAATLDCSNSKVSRLENGKGVPRLRDVRDLVGLYGVGETRAAELMQLVKEGVAETTGLISDFGDVLDGDMVNDDVRRFMELEQGARSILSFEVDYVPGLLQTPAYVEALVRLVDPGREPKQLDRFVTLRQERQDLLKRRGPDESDPLSLSLIVSEQAFRRPIGGPRVMRDQLRAVVSGLRNGLSFVDFQVVPIDLVSAPALGGAFTVLGFTDDEDQDVVYMEGRKSAVYLENDVDVTDFRDQFAALSKACPSKPESITLLEEIAANLT